MLNDNIRVSAVSYVNTLPFIYGIKNSNLPENFIFELNFPALCAQKLIDNEVDISLIPVAAIPLVKNPVLISDFCIGAYGNVRSVLLISDVPLDQIETILLDYQSRTSVNLVQILANKLWKIKPKWIKAEVGFENNISGNVAGVLIGDRTFSLIRKYPFIFDLSTEWFKLTGLPFVFAAWAANKEIDPQLLIRFNEALKFGINHISEVAAEYHHENPGSTIDLFDYLSNNISFNFDLEKRKSVKLFYQYLVELQLIPEKSLKGIRLI